MFIKISVILATCLLLLLLPCLITGFNPKIIGKGIWSVENAYPCPDAEQYEIGFSLKRKKVNRTHDGFDAVLELQTEITDTNTGIFAEGCIKVDGGCKPMMTIEDVSFCNFVRQYAESNSKDILKAAGLEEDCPIPKGRHEVHNYVFDYSELPEDGMLGNFQTTIYFLRGEKRIACFMIDASFESQDSYVPEFGWK